MKTKRKTTHQPIKDLPLHNPGQSLQRQLDVAIEDATVPLGLAVALAIVLAGMEWIHWGFALPPSPVLVSIVALGIVGWGVWQLFAKRRTIDQLRTGLVGERAVGQYLQNALLRKGYWVVHDVCEDDYNIDHVLIGPGGVFSIETKTFTKPRGDARVDYDGRQVKVNGRIPDRDPVAQAQACAKRLQRILLEKTGTKVPVRSVVLFPGWYVNDQPKGVETWVLNEKNLVGFLNHEPLRFQPEEIFTLAAALGHYVREKDGQ